MRQILGFFTIIIVLIIVYYYCITKVAAINEDTFQQTKMSLEHPIDIVFERNGTVDCSLTRLPCITNQQCIDNCVNRNIFVGNNTMVCDQGYCLTRDSQITGSSQETKECDQSLGLIRAFVASEFVVGQVCISTYRDVVDDQGQIRPYVCDNGLLDINVAERQFSVNDCICDTGYTRFIFSQTSFVRNIPVCVPDAQASLFTRIYG